MAKLNGPKDTVLLKFESAVATGKEGLLVVRARSVHLEEGTGDAGGTRGVAGVSVAAARAGERGLQPVRPVPDGAFRIVRAAAG